MLKAMVGYNTLDEEIEIIDRVAVKGFEEVKSVASVEDLREIREQFKRIHVDSDIKRYIAEIIFATRFPKEYGVDGIEEYISFGASPRASIDLYKASCAVALLRGKDFVTPLDISYVVESVLRHRVVLNYKAQANDISSETIIQKILETIKTP